MRCGRYWRRDRQEELTLVARLPAFCRGKPNLPKHVANASVSHHSLHSDALHSGLSGACHIPKGIPLTPVPAGQLCGEDHHSAAVGSRAGVALSMERHIGSIGARIEPMVFYPSRPSPGIGLVAVAVDGHNVPIREEVPRDPALAGTL
jgi:hypothetical protein